MKKKRNKFAVGTEVRCSEYARRVGFVQGYDDNGWCLVGFSKTFEGHSGCGRVEPIAKRYMDHCWYVHTSSLTKVLA